MSHFLFTFCFSYYHFLFVLIYTVDNRNILWWSYLFFQLKLVLLLCYGLWYCVSVCNLVVAVRDLSHLTLCKVHVGYKHVIKREYYPYNWLLLIHSRTGKVVKHWCCFHVNSRLCLYCTFEVNVLKLFKQDSCDLGNCNIHLRVITYSHSAIRQSNCYHVQKVRFMITLLNKSERTYIWCIHYRCYNSEKHQLRIAIWMVYATKWFNMV